jgi:hypothetical protein
MAYIEENGLSEPTVETQYLRPILNYTCEKGGEKVQLLVYGGVRGVRFKLKPAKTD